MTDYELYFGHCERSPAPHGVRGEVNLSAPWPEGRALLEVHLEPHFSTPPSKAGVRAAERVKQIQRIFCPSSFAPIAGLGLTSEDKFCIKKEDHDDVIEVKNIPPLFLSHLKRRSGGLF
jgi:hypothetical protein